MVVKSESIVMIFDVGSSMASSSIASLNTDSVAFYEAQKCISLLIERKIFTESKDKIALILIGNDGKEAKVTDEEFYSDKQNITIIQGLQEASWNLYEKVVDIKSSSLDTTNTMRACGLDVAINLFQSTMDIKKLDSVRKRIMFLSDFDGYFCSDRMNIIYDELKANNIELNVVSSESFCGEFSEVCSEKSKAKTKWHILELLTEVEGESYSYCDVRIPLSKYKMKSVQPMPSYINLDIGTLTIPISVYMKIAESKPKPWNSAYSHGDGEKPKKTTTYCMNDENSAYSHGDGEKLKKTTTYCMNDENQTRVSPEDIISAYKYGTTLVPFSEVDKKNMEYESGGKGMKLLGFTKASNVKRHLYAGNSSKYVYGHKNDESAKEALAAYVQALHSTNMVAVVRFVSTPRSAPVIGFLSPRITEKSECLAFITLPYMEDIRHFVFTSLESDSKNIPSDEQLHAVDEFITSMDLTTITDEDEDEILKPKYTVNPYLQILCQCLQGRALYPELPLRRSQTYEYDIRMPPPKLLERAKASFKKVQSLFPVKELEPLPKVETYPFCLSPHHANYDDIIKEVEDGYGSETKVKYTEANFIDAVTDEITKVSPVHPVRDIQYLTKHHIVPFDEICEQIHDVVNRFLYICDDLKLNHPKVLPLLREYRCASLREANCEKYNLYMIGLQKCLLAKHGELWNQMQNEKLGLISNLELPSSSISSEKAEAYLSQLDLRVHGKDLFDVLVPCVDDDDEDLMDQL